MHIPVSPPELQETRPFKLFQCIDSYFQLGLCDALAFQLSRECANAGVIDVDFYIDVKTQYIPLRALQVGIHVREAEKTLLHPSLLSWYAAQGDEALNNLTMTVDHREAPNDPCPHIPKLTAEGERFVSFVRDFLSRCSDPGSIMFSPTSYVLLDEGLKVHELERHLGLPPSNPHYKQIFMDLEGEGREGMDP